MLKKVTKLLHGKCTLDKCLLNNYLRNVLVVRRRLQLYKTMLHGKKQKQKKIKN